MTNTETPGPDPGGGLPFQTLAELLGTEDPERAFVLEHYIALGAKTLIVSRPKVGKSTWAFGLVNALQREEPYCGLKTAKGVGVLYLTEETSREATRLKAERAGIDLDDPTLRVLRRADVHGMQWPDVVAQVRDFAVAWREDANLHAVVIILDTLSSWAGFSEGGEQDSAATTRALDAMNIWAATDFAVLVLHHAGWSAKRSRGSSAIVGAVDVVTYLEGTAGTTTPRTLVYQGGRLDDGNTPQRLNIHADGSGRLALIGEGHRQKTAAKLSDVFHLVDSVRPDGMTVAAVSEALDCSTRTAQRYLSELVGTGWLLLEDQAGGEGGGRVSVYRAAGGMLRLILDLDGTPDDERPASDAPL
jgi:AAA domain